MLIHLLRPLFAITRRGLWLALAIAVLISGPAWSQEYTVTDLGTLGGVTSAAVAVNNAGQVVGTANVTGDSHSDPFLYSAKKMTDVWTGGTEFGGITVALNNSGHFVVNYNLDAQGHTESFINNGVIWADLGIGGAAGMNASDTVVGNGPNGYWVYSNGYLNTTPSYSIPGGGKALAYSINNAGAIAGECPKADPYYGGQNGCVFGPDGSTVLLNANLGELDPFPPYAISSSGETCGMNGIQQFGVWSDTGAETYAATVGYMAQCAGLDSYGDAVGYGTYGHVGEVLHGYIYDPVNKLRDMNGLISHLSVRGHGVTINFAVSIADTGYIAADCTFEEGLNNFRSHACLLTPNWSAILHDNIVAQAQGDPECIQCKAELEPEAKSLPSSFTGLSTEEKKKALATVEKIDSQLSAIKDGDRISEQAYITLMHDTDMALRALGYVQK